MVSTLGDNLLLLRLNYNYVRVGGMGGGYNFPLNLLFVLYYGDILKASILPGFGGKVCCGG